LYLLGGNEKFLALLVGSGGVGSVLGGPGEGVLESGEKVDKSPGDDDIVVEGDGKGSEHGGKTDTSETRVDSTEHTDVTSLELLTERELEHKHGDTNEEKAAQIGDEEEGSTPFEAKVRETPEVSKTDCGSDSGEDESGGVCPPLTTISFISISEEFNELTHESLFSFCFEYNYMLHFLNRLNSCKNILFC